MKQIVSVLAAFAVSGCAMTVDVTVQRLPAMNTAGINRIAVMPFEVGDSSPLQQEAARLLTAEAGAKIQGANRFVLVDAADIQARQNRGESLDPYVDALFIGQIITLYTGDTARQEERYDKDGKVYHVTVYDREVTMSFTYNFRRVRDGSLVGMIRKEGVKYDHAGAKQDLRSYSDLLRSIVDEQLANLERDVAPYTARETRTLMQEPSKDKVLQTQMKDIYKQVQQGNYRYALQTYLEVYAGRRNFAAGYNAAILYEVAGDLAEAIALMQSVAAETGNPKAASEAERLRKALRDQELLASVYADTQSRSEKLAAEAVRTLLTKLPKDAGTAVLNISGAETALAGAIADGITYGLQQAGVPIVNWEYTSLVDAEKQYQLSGNVGDEDLVSIGSAAGIHTFVLVGITGMGSLRRLNVRVLDVARNTVIYQSPQSEDWTL